MLIPGGCQLSDPVSPDQLDLAKLPPHLLEFCKDPFVLDPNSAEVRGKLPAGSHRFQQSLDNTIAEKVEWVKSNQFWTSSENLCPFFSLIPEISLHSLQIGLKIPPVGTTLSSSSSFCIPKPNYSPSPSAASYRAKFEN